MNEYRGSSRPPRNPRGGQSPRPYSGGPRREGGGGGTGGGYSRGPRPEGGFNRGPRPDGPRSFDRGPRREGGAGGPGGGFSRGPRPEGGFSRGPRAEGGYNRGPRTEGGYNRGPRTEGGFSRGPRPDGPRSYDRGPRRDDAGAPRRSFDRGPRSEGGYDRGPRPDGPRSYDRGPRREGGFSRGPRPEGGFNRGPRPDGPRSYDRGPRRDDAGAPRRSFDRGPRPDGPRSFDRGPRRDDRAPEGMPTRMVRWRRDGKPSPATPPAWKKDSRPLNVRDDRPAPFDESQGGAGLPSDPREASLRILHAVDTRSAFSDRLLDGAHQRPGADARDRALLHELVKGTLRWRARLDWALDGRVHIGLDAVQPWIRNILRIGAYQILMLDRIPAHAAVDESVKLAHKYGHAGSAGLVNSVLRRLLDEKDAIEWPAGDDVDSLAVWGSHPKWIVERWLARFGVEDTRALLMANNRPVATGLRVNALRGTRDELRTRLQSEGVESREGELSPDLLWVEGHHSPGALLAFRDGWCTAQDESESLVGRVVAPEQHDRVLDLCAAPGGKSTHIAELMKDEGEVWALERDKHRVASLEATVRRLGADAVHCVHGDGTTYEFPMPFDRVLVDAPCSGLGVLGRRADARWRKGPEVLAEMPPVQLELLDAASYRVRPGGVLVYSVCTFEPEETDHVVERFLALHPDFALESVKGLVHDAVVTPEGTMRVLPQRHGCDGAFAARMRKK
ncbi:MAG: 16S rRNA (cytosine(967)-C(5))-methyltransferase RsmB [Candidatus Eisenbacteria bacterium]